MPQCASPGTDKRFSTIPVVDFTFWSASRLSGSRYVRRPRCSPSWIGSPASWAFDPSGSA